MDKPEKKREYYDILSEESDAHSRSFPQHSYNKSEKTYPKEQKIEMIEFSKSPLFSFDQKTTNPLLSDFRLPKQSETSSFSLATLCSTLQIITHYIYTDIRKKPRAFKIGVFSIFIVVSFLIVLQNAKQLTPALFIRLSEAQTGDSDLILRSVALENDTRLTNQTYISSPFHGFRMLDGVNLEEQCEKLQEAEGCSARWMLLGKTKNQGKSIKTFVFVVDSKKERSIGLGRGSKTNDDVLEENQCFLTESTVRALDVGEDNRVELNIDVLESLISQENVAFSDNSHGNKASTNEKILNLKSKLQESFNQTLENILNFMENSSNNSNISLFQQLSSIPELDFLAPFFENLPENVKNDANLLFLLRENRENLEEFSQVLLESLLDTLNLTINLQIKQRIKSPKGKWPSVLGNVIVLDHSWIPTIITNEFLKNLGKNIGTNENLSIFSWFYDEQALRNLIDPIVEKSFDLKKFAMFEYVTFKNKLQIYSNEKEIDKKMVEITNNFAKIIGKNYTTQGEIALSGVIKRMSIIKSFLDNVFGSSVMLLILLSILLIYSLMLSNIDEKTFEFGMLRALGFNKFHLILLLCIQALFYAFLGMFLAFLFSIILNNFISYIIYDYAMLSEGYSFDKSALILGFTVGFFMPIVSNLLPIVRALSKTLRDSLDLFHREINIFKVRVMKLEKLGVSLYQSLNSCVLIFMGISSYYLAPKAFIMQDIALFLWIMNLILSILLIGLTVLLNLFETFVEKLVLKILLFFLYKDKKLESIVLKNMKGHASRNIKTALMFSITMSFLIFAATGFQLQETVINDSFRLHIGSDMTAEIPANSKKSLDEQAFRRYLEDYKRKYPDRIAGYSFISIPLDQIPYVNFPWVSPLSFFPRKRVAIKAIEENFMQCVYSYYYIPTEYNEKIRYNSLEDGKRDPVSSLYLRENQENFTKIHDFHNLTSNNELFADSPANEELPVLRFLMPEGMRNFFGLDTSFSAMIFMGHQKYPSKINAMIAKLPGFGMFFSSYLTASKMLLTSMPTFQFLMERDWKDKTISNATIQQYYSSQPQNLSYGIPKEKILIKFARPLNSLERNELANGLRNQFSDSLIMLFDTMDFIADTEESFFYLDLFYYIVAIISLILTFFLILVSFHSNVKEHVWEFGVLRALGLNKLQMTRIYIYEALSLTISAGIIGSIVGSGVALVLTLQYLTFAEIPLKFNFPVYMFTLTFFCGVLTAIVGTLFAVKEIREKSISNIIKGLN